jgi:small subunit ribosomal protein S6
MPLYQLFAIAKPTLPLSGMASTLRTLGGMVFSSGGVVTDITSYGEQDLAYPLKTQAGKYTEVPSYSLCEFCKHLIFDIWARKLTSVIDSYLVTAVQAQMVAMDFLVGPKLLPELDHALRVNEDVLRWVVLKKSAYDRLPRTTKELEELKSTIAEFRVQATTQTAQQ